MQELQISFTAGPMSGQSSLHELGSLVLGREPRPGPGQQALLLPGADSSMSRNHLLLFDRNGEVVLENLSGNGTRVNGKLVMEQAVLKPGANIDVGSHHSFRVQWELLGGQQPSTQEKVSAVKSASSVASSGLLGSPVVRTLLVVYIAAIIAVAGYLSWRGDRKGEIRDDWPELSAAYADYQPAGLEESEKARRAQLAEAILVRLRVLRANERKEAVERLCRELMRLDADIKSPVYLYGAKCLGSIE
jgi:hypothetical protein